MSPEAFDEATLVILLLAAAAMLGLYLARRPSFSTSTWTYTEKAGGVETLLVLRNGRAHKITIDGKKISRRSPEGKRVLKDAKIFYQDRFPL